MANLTGRISDLIPSALKGPTSEPISPLSKDHKARARLFELLWTYYRGAHRKGLKVKPGDVDDNVTINLSKKAVNFGIGFLFGKPVTFEVDGDDTRSKQEQYLDSIWGEEADEKFQKENFLEGVAQNGGVCGTAFIRIYPAEEGGKPRIVNINPTIVDIISDPDDLDLVEEYRLLWKGDEWKRHRMINKGGSWEIVEEIWVSENKWTSSDEPTVWDFSWAPLFHCQNLVLANSLWGISDLEDADLNDAINFAASNINRVLRFHAHPKTMGTGFAASQLQTTAVDQFWTTESADAKVFNLEMQSDLGSSRAFKADLEESFHQLTNIPRLDPQSVNLGALSGFALKILYGPLLTMTERKRRTYGGLLKQVNHALLALNKMEVTKIKNVWLNPLPIARLERAEEAATLIGTGANREEAYKVAGYTSEEAAKLAQTRLLPRDAPPGSIEVRPDGEEGAPVNIDSTEGLNGAQIMAATNMLQGVSAGTIASLVAYELLVALGIQKERARRMVDAAKATRAPQALL